MLESTEVRHMAGDGDEAKVGRARRKKGAAKEAREGGPKRKCSLMLSEESWERLSVHALKSRVAVGELVERLISDNCRRYVVSDRGDHSPSRAEASPDESANDAVEGLPVGETLHAFQASIEEPRPGGGEGSEGPAPGRERTSRRRSA
jgi:hypothetical protein